MMGTLTERMWITPRGKLIPLDDIHTTEIRRLGFDDQYSAQVKGWVRVNMQGFGIYLTLVDLPKRLSAIQRALFPVYENIGNRGATIEDVKEEQSKVYDVDLATLAAGTLSDIRGRSRGENPLAPPHKTAIARGGRLPAPVADMRMDNKLRGRILDFGAGRGDAVRVLRSQGLDVEGYDVWPDFGFPMPPGLFDTVYSAYVLNVIEDPVARLGAVSLAWTKVKPGGRLYLFARSDVGAWARKSGWVRSGDGYITGRGTFRRDFTRQELVELLKKMPSARVLGQEWVGHKGYAFAAAEKNQ